MGARIMSTTAPEPSEQTKDTVYRRTIYRKKTKEVRLKREVADRIKQLFPTISGLPRKTELLLEYYEATHDQHNEVLETLIAKQASLPRELYSPRAEERARNLKKEENDEDDSSDSPQASGVPYDGGSSTEDDESMEIDLEENEISKALAADTIPPERLSSHENDVASKLLAAVQEGNLRNCRKYLKSLPDANSPLDQKNSTALWLACRNGFDGLVRAVLKDKRTDPNAATVDGYTPIGVACFMGSLSVVDILLDDPRTEPNRPNSKGCSPLYLAFQGGHFDIIAALIRHQNYQVTDQDYELISRSKNAVLTSLLFLYKPPPALAPEEITMIQHFCENEGTSADLSPDNE